MKHTTAHLHLLCQDWTRTLQFYKTEIPYFKKRLVEISTKNTGEDIRKEIEHFENKFIVLNEDLDQLQHNVNLQQDAAMKSASEKPLFINVRMAKVDDNLGELIESFEKEFAKNKTAFYRFLSNTM
ncbi:MAG: hypothetical protein ACKVOM_06525 [Ferruginibacter sp.]